MTVNHTNDLESLSTTADFLQWVEYTLIQRQTILGFCLFLSLITFVYANTKKKAVITTLGTTTNEPSKEKLDDYSYRDLFHFFINPEYHWNKLHLAKG